MHEAQTSGYHDFSYGGTITAPTGSKPESKLWFNDGIWWAVLFNTSFRGPTSIDYTPTQVWSDTGTTVDDRVPSVRRGRVVGPGVKPSLYSLERAR